MWTHESVIIPLDLVHAESGIVSETADYETRCISQAQMECYMAPGIFLNTVSYQSWIPASTERSQTSNRTLCRRFDDHIQNYSKRSLSYNIDTFNAIDGILQEYFIHPSNPLNLILGLPVSASQVNRSDSGQDFGEGLDGAKKRVKRWAGNRLSRTSSVEKAVVSLMGTMNIQLPPALPLSFGYALAMWNNASNSLWLQCQRSYRKPEFPSWTWAGWGGPLTTWISYWHHEDILSLGMDQYTGIN
jgi:hypothetical protein